MTIELTGRDILGYRMTGLLGEGGMATVWRAEHPMLGKAVAIKVLDPLLARDRDLVQRFVDEARIQIELQHPNIVAIENFSDDPLAMIMEFVEGRSLDEMIGREVGPIPIQTALPLMTQILEAVGYAHQHGIIHRDIKPGNVLVTPNSAVKVVDFGIAKILGGSRMTQTGTSMGTAAYMSPEQIKGAKDVDARSDIYSLGVTFYEMLAGRTPFEGDPEKESDFEIRNAQVFQEPPDPRAFYPAIPDAVVGMVMKSLAKAPDDRHQSCAEMLAALEAAARGQEAPQVKHGSPGALPATQPLPTPGLDIKAAPSVQPAVLERPPPAPNSTNQKARSAPPVSAGPSSPSGSRKKKTLLLVGVLASLAVLSLAGAIIGVIVLRNDEDDRNNLAAAATRYDELLRSSQLAENNGNLTTALQHARDAAPMAPEGDTRAAERMAYLTGRIEVKRRDEGARRIEEARIAEEVRRAEEARRAAEEAQRAADTARQALAAQLAQEARRAEDARRAEEARVTEEAHAAEVERQDNPENRRKAWRACIRRECTRTMRRDEAARGRRYELVGRIRVRGSKAYMDYDTRARNDRRSCWISIARAQDPCGRAP